MNDIEKITPSLDRGFSFFTKERIILGSIILFLFFIIVYIFINQIDLKSEIIKNNYKIEELTKENQTLTQKNLDIEKKFTTFENNINDIYNKIDKNNIKINNIKKITNEKVLNVDSYSINELEEFFTKRYGSE